MRDERVRSRCDIAVTETPLVGCDEASSVRVRTLGRIENDSLPDRRSTRVDRESCGSMGAILRGRGNLTFQGVPLMRLIKILHVMVSIAPILETFGVRRF